MAKANTKTTKKRKVKQVIDPDIEEPDVAPTYAFPEEDPDKDFVDQLNNDTDKDNIHR